MFVRVFMFAGVVVSLMAAVANGHPLRWAGLTSTCSVLETHAGGVQLESCRAGWLDGLPDLSRRGCTNVGVRGKDEYWSCPGR
jgi:hypothetical protein